MPPRKIITAAAERLTVTLDAADKVELEKLSKASDRSLAWLVRDAIRQYIDKARSASRGGVE